MFKYGIIKILLVVKKKRSNKGLLIKGMIEKVPASSFGVLRKELKGILKGKSGIYALYKGDKVFYVGLAKELYWRTFHHLERDRMANRWDSFSVFIIKRIKYLKDLETLVLRISKPKGNRVKGKLPEHNLLRENLRKRAKHLKDEVHSIEKALR